MTAPLAALADRFRFNENVLGMTSEDFEEGDWAASAGPKGGNTAHWILGHVASTRRYLLRKLGGSCAEDEWEQDFGAGAKPGENSGYPAPGELVQDILASGEKLGARMAAMSDEECRTEWGAAFPDGGTTLGDGAHFLYFHECYHLGQLGLLRRINGRPGFI